MLRVAGNVNSRERSTPVSSSLFGRLESNRAFWPSAHRRSWKAQGLGGGRAFQWRVEPTGVRGLGQCAAAEFAAPTAERITQLRPTLFRASSYAVEERELEINIVSELRFYESAQLIQFADRRVAGDVLKDGRER